jgi:hypothetical protein
MKYLPRVLFLIPLSLAFAGGVDAYEANCRGAGDCARKGDAAYRKHEYKAAIAFYKMQMQDVEEDKADCEQASSGDAKKACGSTIVAYNNLALASLRAGEPAKAQMWLAVAPDGAITRSNRRVVAKALASLRWPSSPEGEYWRNAGYGLWSEVTVKKTENDSYQVAFEGHWMPEGGWNVGAHSGHLSATVPIRNGVAVLRGEDDPRCVVTARFSADHLELLESDDCNGIFGVNVAANGTFTRVSAPRLER